MVETKSEGPQGPSRVGPVALVLVLSAGAGILAGVLIHSYRSAREAEQNREEYEKRLVDLEKRYGDLAKGPPAVDPAERMAGMRASKAELFRRDYKNILGEVKRITGLEGAAWEKAEAVLQRHFEPMDRALDSFEKSPGWQPPNIQRVMARRVPVTLEELRAAMSSEAWGKFNAWRRPKAGTAEIWRRPRYAYFLLPEEYRAVTGASASALRWNLASPSIRKLCSRLGLPRHEQKELEAALRDHLNRYTAAVGGLGAGATRPADSEKRIAAAIKLTEDKVGRLLGAERFKTYVEWRDALEEPARGYFRPGPAQAGNGEVAPAE